MEDNRIDSAATEQPAVDGVDYIAAINELKANTVDRAAYDKLKQENQQLLNSLVNGETITQEVEAPDIKELQDSLFGHDGFDGSNLEYMQKVLALRDTIMSAGGTDPFLPWGKKITPTQEDVDTAERVANVLKECIEYAEGDSDVFTNELQRRMIDSSPTKPNRR